MKEPQASIESFSYIRAAAIFEESPLSSEANKVSHRYHCTSIIDEEQP